MIQKIKNSLKKRKVKVFLACLIFSTLAWVISNLSESYISNTTFDLEFSNVNQDMLLVSSSQSQLNARLEAVGFQFLGFNFKNKAVSIDLSEAVKDGSKYYIPFREFKAQIEKQLPNSMRIIDLEKDTLFFDFQAVISKEVPVVPIIKLSLDQNYLLDGEVKVNPSKVVLRGPKNEIDTMTSVKSSKIDLISLNTNFSRKAELIKPKELNYSSISSTTVTISGKVSKFSEKLLTVQVKAINLPKGTTVKMFPDKVKVLCKGTIHALKNVTVADINVVADFESHPSNESNTIALKLASIPKTLSNATLQENEVEYILKREK